MANSTICEVSELLVEGAKEVFETMVFMSIEKSSDDTPLSGENLLGTITFTGSAQGCVGICCSGDCAKSIAANMMGLDDTNSSSNEDVADAIGEIANMIMGSFKSRILPVYDVVNVSIPSVARGGNLDAMLIGGCQKTIVSVIIDEYPSKLILLFKTKCK